MKPYSLIYNSSSFETIACYLKESLFCKSHAYQLDLKLIWIFIRSCLRRNNRYADFCVCQLIRSLSKFLDKFEICRWKPKSHSWFEARCVNTKWSAWTGSSPCMKTTSTEFSPTKWVSLFPIELPCISICYMADIYLELRLQQLVFIYESLETCKIYFWQIWTLLRID